MYNYIPLPTNMRDFSQVLTLRIEEGSAGYGVYVMVLQLLRDMPEYSMGDNPKRIAFALNEPDVAMVDRVLHNYGLFDINGDGLLSSPWLSEQLSAYDQKKKKLQEAGRRGAAKRFGSSSNGEAIATPSNGDGEAIAIEHNATKYNVSRDNETTPSESCGEDWKIICSSQGLRVDEDYVVAIAATQPEGHAPGYIAQVCCQYGIGQNVLEYLLRVTDNANKTDRLYKAFCGLVQRIQRDKYIPTYPANFFCSKLAEIH